MPFDITQLEVDIPDTRDVVTKEAQGGEIHDVTWTTRYLTMVECLILSGHPTLITELSQNRVPVAREETNEETGEKSVVQPTDEEKETFIRRRVEIDEKIKHASIIAGVTHIDGQPVKLTEAQVRKLSQLTRATLYSAINGDDGGGGQLVNQFQEKAQDEHTVS